MQILILYFSKGGNTKKLAEAIAQGVESVEGVVAVLKNTEEVTKEDFINSQGIIAGSPVYFGVMAAELKKIFDKFVGVRRKMEDKIGAAFVTSGDPSGSRETTMMSITQALLIFGMVVVGHPMSATEYYGGACTVKPDSKTKHNGMKFRQRVAGIVKNSRA